jgi:hypothetical protein
MRKNPAAGLTRSTGSSAIHEDCKVDFATLCIRRSPEEKRNGKKAKEGKRQRPKSRPR